MDSENSDAASSRSEEGNHSKPTTLKYSLLGSGVLGGFLILALAFQNCSGFTSGSGGGSDSSSVGGTETAIEAFANPIEIADATNSVSVAFLPTEGRFGYTTTFARNQPGVDLIPFRQARFTRDGGRSWLSVVEDPLATRGLLLRDSNSALAKLLSDGSVYLLQVNHRLVENNIVKERSTSVWMSFDHGETWQDVTTFLPGTGYFIALDLKVIAGRLWISGGWRESPEPVDSQSTVFGVVSWDLQQGPSQLNAFRFDFAPGVASPSVGLANSILAVGDCLYVGGYRKGAGSAFEAVLHRTCDKGLNWTLEFADITSVRFSEVMGVGHYNGTLFALSSRQVGVGSGSELRLWKKNQGGSWESSVVPVIGMPSSSSQEAQFLAVSSSGVVVIGFHASGGAGTGQMILQVSKDGGNSWTGLRAIPGFFRGARLFTDRLYFAYTDPFLRIAFVDLL